MIVTVWTDLSIRHLLALQAVAEEGTFGRAAERLGFTQSAVSQQVAALEQIVGELLFDRPAGPRRPRLTPAGELVLEHAHTVLDRVEHAERELGRFVRGESGSIAIGTFQSAAVRLLPRILTQLRREAPDVDALILEEDTELDFRLGALRRGDIDVAFFMSEPPDDCESALVFTDHHVAVVPADEPDGPIQLAALAHRPIVGMPVGDSWGRHIERELGRVGVVPEYAFRSHDNGAVQAMVSAGIGIAIMSQLTVDPTDHTVSIRSTVPAVAPRTIWIAWARDRSLSPLARRTIEVAVDVGAALAADLERLVGRA